MNFLSDRLKRGFKLNTNFLTRAGIVVFAVALVAQPFQPHVYALSSTVCAVSCDADSVQTAIDTAVTGDTISFAGDVTLSHALKVTKSLTILGNGHSISPSFAKSVDDTAALMITGANSVTVSGLTVDGSGGTSLHGINVYKSTNVNLNDVTTTNNDRSGLVVNGSTVTVNNITTSGNGWHGINVDQGSGVTTPAILTINGVSRQTDTVNIFIDSINRGSVVDNTGQYKVLVAGLSRIYTLPSVTAQDFGTWNDAPSYKAINVGFKLSNFTHIDNIKVSLQKNGSELVANTASASLLSNVNAQTNGFSLDGQLSSPFIVSGTLNDTYCGGSACWVAGNHTWTPAEQPDEAVITVTQNGVDYVARTTNFSTSTATFDSLVAPVAPTLTSPSNGATVNGATVTQSWNASTSTDFDYYVYESYSNETATSLRWHQNVYSTSKTATNVGDSMFWWRVKAVDTDGNESAWSPLWKLTVDNTAPTTPTLASPTNNSYQNINDFYFDWSDSSDASAVTYEFQSSQTPTTSNGVLTTGVWNSILNGNAEQNNLTTSQIHSVGANGTWYWQVRAIDAAGNKSAWTPVWKMTIDMTAPVVNVDELPNNGLVNGDEITIHGTVNDTHFQEYRYQLLDENKQNTLGNSVIGGNTPIIDGGLATIDVSQLADGNYFVRVWAKDKAGNQTGTKNAPYTVAFTIDRTAPVVTDTFAANLKTGDKLSLAPSVTGDTDVTYNWTVSDPKLTTDPKDALNGQTLSIGPAPAGSYTVDLVVTDKAGNKTTKLYTVTIATPDNSSQNVDTSNTGRQNSVLGSRTLAGDQTNGEQPEVLGASTVATTTPVEESGDNTADNSSDNQTTPDNYDWVWWAAPAGAIVLGGAAWWLLARRRGGE